MTTTAATTSTNLLEKRDRSILPARVDNHNAGFTSFGASNITTGAYRLNVTRVVLKVLHYLYLQRWISSWNKWNVIKSLSSKTTSGEQQGTNNFLLLFKFW